MRIAIFSDIHSNYLVFKKAFEDSLNRNVDMYIYLGDYVTDGFDANKIIDIIKSSNGHAINGNRELSILDYHNNKDINWEKYIQFNSMKYGYDCLNKDSIDYIDSLPIYKIINIEGKKICLSHGTPYNVRERVQGNSYEIFDKLIEDFNCDIYLFGHEHVFYCTKYNDKLFINPGSIGLPSEGLPFKYGILTIEKDNINYEKIEIDYSYEELEKYYKESDYYKKASLWCSLNLMVLKTGYNYSEEFINYANNRARELNINIEPCIPNDLFQQCYLEYINKFDV